MPKKKVSKKDDDKSTNDPENSSDEETAGEDAIDPAIIEDTFSEEFSEYNDVDNF